AGGGGGVGSGEAFCRARRTACGGARGYQQREDRRHGSHAHGSLPCFRTSLCLSIRAVVSRKAGGHGTFICLSTRPIRGANKANCGRSDTIGNSSCCSKISCPDKRQTPDCQWF